MEKCQKIKTTSGNKFFYNATGTTYGLLSINFHMTEKVDGDVYRKAVEAAMERYPYLCVKPEIIDGTSYLVPNERPFVVTDDGEYTPLGEEASNYHLITFTYLDDEIRINYDHALLDGRGGLDPLYSVLYYYCKFKYDDNINCPGVKTVDVPIAAEEYESPYVREFPDPEIADVCLPQSWYAVPESGTGERGICRIYTVLADQESFMNVCKSGDSSPASLATLLLLKAIDKVHPEHAEHLACIMPADYRAAINMPETHQNAYAMFPLLYHNKMKNMPLSTQLTAMRGQIISQADPDQLIKKFKADQKLCRKALATETLEEKRALYGNGIQMSVTYPIFSYIGQCDFGDVKKYVKSMCLFHSGYDSILLEMIAWGNSFCLAFSFGFEGTEYLDAYTSLLDELGIKYERGREYRYHLPIRNY